MCSGRRMALSAKLFSFSERWRYFRKTFLPGSHVRKRHLSLIAETLVWFFWRYKRVDKGNGVCNELQKCDKRKESLFCKKNGNDTCSFVILKNHKISSKWIFFLKFYLVYNGFYVELLLDHYYHSWEKMQLLQNYCWNSCKILQDMFGSCKNFARVVCILQKFCKSCI